MKNIISKINEFVKNSIYVPVDIDAKKVVKTIKNNMDGVFKKEKRIDVYTYTLTTKRNDFICSRINTRTGEVKNIISSENGIVKRIIVPINDWEKTIFDELK